MIGELTWTPFAVAAIAGLFGGGGVVAMMKVGKEGSRIIVSAAEGAVVVQVKVIETLQSDLRAARTEIATMRTDLQAAQREASVERSARWTAEWKAQGLEERVRLLQADVDALKRRVNGKGDE